MGHPDIIYIVRHGEKPGENHIEGPDDGPNLSARGHSRAHGLVIQLPSKPDFAIATKKSKNSVRPIETITPYADIHGVKLITKWADEEYKQLAQELLTKKKYHDATIVIAWHHGKIPALIKALGGDNTVLPITKGIWDANVFDRIIMLEFGTPIRSGDDTAHTVNTTSHPQKLLFGDSDK